MTTEKEVKQEVKQEQPVQMVSLETKVQTIYFEDAEGEMSKYHHVSDKRLNKKDAEEVLLELGYEINLLLRTVTERLTIEMTREELQEKIKNTERFYQTQKQ